MSTPPLDKIREWLADIAAERPTCEQCTRRRCITYSECDSGQWFLDPLRCEYLRHCSTCASRLAYPWASTLDVHRVQAWLRDNLQEGCRIDLDKLRRDCADRGGFSFL